MNNIKKDMFIFDDSDDSDDSDEWDTFDGLWSIYPTKVARRIQHLEKKYNTIPTRVGMHNYH
jgi:hypothetical protein